MKKYFSIRNYPHLLLWRNRTIKRVTTATSKYFSIRHYPYLFIIVMILTLLFGLIWHRIAIFFVAIALGFTSLIMLAGYLCEEIKEEIRYRLP